MSRSPSLPTHQRRGVHLAIAAALAFGSLAVLPVTAHADDAVTIRSGSISWGLKSSFRSYVTGYAQGTVTATAPATDDGTRTTFPTASGSWSGTSASVGAKGAVTFTAHAGVLDVTLSDPRIAIVDGTASLVVDAVDSDQVTYDDLAIATLNLAGAVTTDATSVTITDAPATLTTAGSAVFNYGGNPMYPAGTVLDPVSASFAIKQAQKVTVSQTSFTDKATATVTVTGSGFYPEDSTATRPPIAGSSAGVYVVVGKFAETWQPSKGAASTARKALSSQTKWAVLAADMATIGGASAGAIELSADGGFSTTMTFTKSALDGISGLTADHVNYGIYTYAGGGATNAAWETYHPLTFTGASVALSAASTTFGSPATVAATLTPATATGTVTLSGAGADQTATISAGTATFTLPADIAVGSHALTATYSGDSAYAGSSATSTLTVAKAAGGITVTAPATTYGTPARVSVTLPAALTGSVTLSGSALAGQTATISNGTAAFTLPASLAPGSRSVTVAYSGDASHEAATATTTVVVTKARPATTLTVSTKPTSKKKGKATVKLAGAAGATAPSGTATVKLTKGKTSKTVTVKLSSGKKALTVPKLAKGTWTVSVKYAGDARYTAFGYVKTGTVKVKK